jgi:hypothetical protein
VAQNLLDLPNIKAHLQKLTQKEQKVLLIQSLRMLQLRDGIIKEVISESKDKSTESYTHFMIEAGRLKP